MPTVLSIQSWVACGNVGNTAALFPLQRLGCETWSLNTVAFSNHTGYGKWRGAAIPAQEIAGLFERIAELGILPRCDAVLSGYLGDAETGRVLLDIIGRVKQANPLALFACDPVMGDVGPGWYVRAGVPEFYRDHAIGMADIVTPNRFELEWLTGHPVTTLAEAGVAAAGLRERGRRIVLVTSLDLADGRIAVVGAGPEGTWAVDTPRLPIEATGGGDAVAALFLGWLLSGKPLTAALAALFEAVRQTYGRIDLLFNNAGISTRGIPFEELTYEQWSNVVAVNLTGSFLCAQHAFRMMKEQQPQGGRIINNGSVSAHVPRRNSTPYVATKHALTGLTRSLSLDGREYNIACGQIDIGNAATTRNEDTARGRLQASGRVEAEARIDVRDVAKGVLYMAELPPEANVLFMTVMANKMPYVGRG